MDKPLPRLRCLLPFVLLTTGLGATDLHALQVDAEPGTRELIRGRVEALRGGMEARAAGRRLRAARALPAFYDARSFTPFWITEPARLGELRVAISRSAGHGLVPGDYHLDVLDSLASALRAGRAAPADSADLDLLASDAYMMLGSHLLHGRVNPETINPEWLANRRSAALDQVLAEAVESGGIERSLNALAPSQVRYVSMVSALARLRRVEQDGGWTFVAEGAELQRGSSGPRVVALRARLTEGGDVVATSGSRGRPPSGDDSFDHELEGAVRRFQQRHGLEADGVVGPATIAVLNTPVSARVRQLETNLERWRWLPADLGRRHIEVNIAGFEVRVVEDGRTVRTHRAVVGRQYRQTPMFTGTMTYLVLSPYWHVPPTIAAVDKFPVMQRDRSAIATQRMTLLDQRTNEVVDPATVAWTDLTGREFNRLYRLRQDPGPHNALGLVKFMFPNAHNVYLHDTPSRELFERAVRNFSSGCIRVENALELAEYLLAGQEGWDRARIDAGAAGGSERVVRLDAPVPVHLLYWTAWAEADGVIHFRDDIYGRDATVRGALESSPPGT